MPDLFSSTLIKTLKFSSFYYTPKQRILPTSWVELLMGSLTPHPVLVLTVSDLGYQKNVCEAEPPKLQKQFLLQSLPAVTPHKRVLNTSFRKSSPFPPEIASWAET